MGGGGLSVFFLVGWLGGWVGGVVVFFVLFPSRLGAWVVGVLCFPFFFLLLLSRFWSRSLVGVVVAPVCRWWSGGCCRAVLLAALCGLLCCCAVLLLPSSLSSRLSSLFPVFVVAVVVVVAAAVVAVVAVVACRFAAVCCCWCCRSSSASPSCGGRFPPRQDFSAGPCQATSSLPLGLPPPPNFDNIVLTHPFSAPISAFGPSVSSVLSCSGHGTAQRTHHPATRGALLWCLPFFFLFPLLFVSCLLVAAPF